MTRLILLTLGMFALGFDAYVVAGLLPNIAQTFSITEAQAGQSAAVFTLSYALSAPLLATLVGGRPIRTILTVALGIFTAANVASAVANSFALLLVARALAGFGAGLFSPSTAAAAAALVPAARKGRALGLVLGGMSAGTVIGVPAGLWVNGWIGWRGTLGLVTLVGLVALIGIATCLPVIPLQKPPSLRDRLSMLTHGQVAATVGISFLTAVGSLGLYTYLAPTLHAVAGISDLKRYLWIWGVGGLAGSFAVGPLIDRTRRPAMLLGAILAALSLSLILLPVLAPTGMAGLLPFLIWGATGWASLAPQQHLLLDSQPEHGPAVVALNSSFNYLGNAVGAFGAGALISCGLAPSMLPYCAAAATLTAMVGHLLKIYVSSKRAAVAI